jgi:hypothetical protein
VLDDLRRITADDRIGRHVGHDHRARGDDRAVAPFMMNFTPRASAQNFPMISRSPMNGK